jgi:hypothetical protein
MILPRRAGERARSDRKSDPGFSKHLGEFHLVCRPQRVLEDSRYGGLTPASLQLRRRVVRGESGDDGNPRRQALPQRQLVGTVFTSCGADMGMIEEAARLWIPE